MVYPNFLHYYIDQTRELWIPIRDAPPEYYESSPVWARDFTSIFISRDGPYTIGWPQDGMFTILLSSLGHNFNEKKGRMVALKGSQEIGVALNLLIFNL